MENATFLTSDNLASRLAFILAFALTAYAVHRGARRIAKYLAQASMGASPLPTASVKARAERRQTIEGIFAGIISLTAVAVAILATLGLFVSLDTLVWMIGLFSAAFGLGARPFISDVLTGIAIVFDNTFTVGEKILFTDVNVEGVVEQVALRTTHVRAPTGELFIIPNGDVRTVRNFSRGLFSQVRMGLIIPVDKLQQALDELEKLGKDAMLELPNLIEPWQILSEDDVGQTAKLVLIAKARHGRGAEMKPRLEALVHARLAQVGIQLGG
ncbi:MAG: mechanosensitive ion channel [Anaerolineales bacterium]|nr:mechanosensitive ion channel [Anaerolineales bacterium]